MIHRLRKLLAGAAALGAVLAIGTAGIAQATPAKRHHHKPHHKVHHTSIPQHNGGDRDADNNGGPSDGDGGI
jgi:hypothetical protein